MSTYHSKLSNSTSDSNWDAFVASLHRVWEYAPDYSPTGPINLSGRKILIVDRDVDHNTQFSERLKRLGSVAFTVLSIQDAYAQLEDQNIELIVLGADLPDGDALAFCRTVGDLTATMNIPTILLSNDDRPEMVWLARRAGATFYLRKPYDPYVLLALMSAALEPGD